MSARPRLRLPTRCGTPLSRSRAPTIYRYEAKKLAELESGEFRAEPRGAGPVATLVADGAASFLAMEEAEDLGALASGPHEGLRPASMWFSGRGCALWFFTSFGTPYATPACSCAHR